MKVHQRPRSIRIWLLLPFVLLLATMQVPTSTAQDSPEQAGFAYLAALQGTSPLASVIPVNRSAVLHTPEGIYHGPAGFEEYASYLQDSFTNLSFVVRDPGATGSQVVLHFVMTGTHTGSYEGMPGNCATVKVPGVAVLSIDGSGITEQWITYDQDTLIEQIDGFHQLDPSNKPDCPQVYPDEPLRDPVCIRRDRCDANS